MKRYKSKEDSPLYAKNSVIGAVERKIREHFCDISRKYVEEDCIRVYCDECESDFSASEKSVLCGVCPICAELNGDHELVECSDCNTRILLSNNNLNSEWCPVCETLAKTDAAKIVKLGTEDRPATQADIDKAMRHIIETSTILASDKTCRKCGENTEERSSLGLCCDCFVEVEYGKDSLDRKTPNILGMKAPGTMPILAIAAGTAIAAIIAQSMINKMKETEPLKPRMTSGSENVEVENPHLTSG